MKNNSKHFYFNSERNNFEQQPKRKISTNSDNGLIGPKSGTTTPKHVYGKRSTSSTSSITSCTLSVLNGNETNSYMANQFNNYNAQMNGMQMTVNPFEETNRFRLEQSVLSPNLFHVANTSTPERDTNSLWNIDQRAILYPADIQTDESSLMAQYVYDYKISKQVIPAVEAFWTQNKIIIESPLACTTGSAFRTKFANNPQLVKNAKANSVNSPFSNDIANNYSHKKTQSVSGSASTNVGSESKPANSAYKPKETLKNQVCQTMLSIPLDFDISKVLEFKNFFISDERAESPEKEINNSIRKKLFDHEDLSSSTTTTTSNTPGQTSSRKLSNGASILISKIKSSNLEAQSTAQGKISQLPKPEVFVSKMDNVKKDAKLRTLASSSSSATTDDWQDSFEFEDHQFASSPKCEKFSNIIYDIGDFGHDDDLHDSVFEQHHRTPPDLSPLLGEIETIKPTMTPIKEMQTPVKTENSTEKTSRSGEANNHKTHHNRFFHFDMASKNTDAINSNNNNNNPVTSAGSGSASKKDKNPSSPNLSPIRQQEGSNLTLHGSESGSVKSKKIKHSSHKETVANADDMNLSSSFAKSVIFMDIGDGLNSSGVGMNELQNCSFSEEIIGYDHHNHYKREEFYKRLSLGDDHIEIENLRKEAQLEKHSKMVSNSNDNFSLDNQNEQNKDLKILGYNLESTKSESDSNFKQLLRSQIVEDDSTTNMEQYISNNLDQGPIDNALKNSNNPNIHNYSKFVEQNMFNTSKPLMTSIIETTTNTFNQDSQDTGYQTNSVINCGNGSTSSNSAQSSSNPSMMNMDTTNNNHNLTSNEIISKVTVTPMNIELYLEEKENKAISKNIQETITAKKADLTNLKSDLKKFIAGSSKRQLNSSHTKTNGKSLNNKSLYSPCNSKGLKIKKNSISLNSLENILGSETPLEGLKLKTSPDSLFKPINSNNTNLLKIKKSPTVQENKSPMKPKSNIDMMKKIHLESTNFNDDHMNSSDVSMSILNNSTRSNAKAADLDECEQMIIKKHELDSLYIDQSILMSKLAPSEYARNVIFKAKTDLNLLENYLSNSNETSHSPPKNLNSIHVNKERNSNNSTA